MAVPGMAVIPALLSRPVFASSAVPAGKKRLVVLFQRGGADGLNIVVPHADPLYYRLRPTIHIPRNQVIDLNGQFGLHPAMSAFKPLWDAKQLAIVHAVGLPNSTRSHFDAQDYMESGMPGVKSAADGWLGRVIVSKQDENQSPFCAVAFGASLPRTLTGGAPAAAINDWNNEHSAATVLHNHETTRTTGEMSKAVNRLRYSPAPSPDYPAGHFAGSLRQIAHLLKADLGVDVAFADIGGWDHHVNEGSSHGQLALTREFSQAIAAFWTDLGKLQDDTVLLTMSEFGRTPRENGTGGTDHGHATVMFVLGGRVNGGKVYGRWPGLDDCHLCEGRNLEVTTDFRTVLAELVERHLGIRQTAKIFPGFEPSLRLNLLAKTEQQHSLFQAI
jgi:uncharacterized protein (DUF1501 family)